MKILILGGTGFVGRILTENLIKTSHDITLFNRGRKKELFVEVKKITGDRNIKEDIEKIGLSGWDVVIDFSGFQPANIELILELLKGKCGRYIFISTGAVYFVENFKSPLTEEDEILGCSKEQRDDPDIIKFYGEKKAEIDRILMNTDYFDTIIFRPAVIYGRYDPTDRFYYWLYRASLDKVLIPDDGRSVSTNTYSEDLARIIESAITKEKHSKVYNATTHSPRNLRDIVEVSSEKLGKHPVYVSVPGDVLKSKGVKPWQDMPLWTGEDDIVMDNSKLCNDFSDVALTSFEKSIYDTIGYYQKLGWHIPKNALTPEREKEIIDEVKPAV